MVGQRRKFSFLGLLKTPVSKKINIGRKSTKSQWLIPFRKIKPSQLTLQRGGNLIIQGQ